MKGTRMWSWARYMPGRARHIDVLTCARNQGHRAGRDGLLHFSLNDIAEALGIRDTFAIPPSLYCLLRLRYEQARKTYAAAVEAEAEGVKRRARYAVDAQRRALFMLTPRQAAEFTANRGKYVTEVAPSGRVWRVRCSFSEAVEILMAPYGRPDAPVEMWETRLRFCLNPHQFAPKMNSSETAHTHVCQWDTLSAMLAAIRAGDEGRMLCTGIRTSGEFTHEEHQLRVEYAQQHDLSVS